MYLKISCLYCTPSHPPWAWGRMRLFYQPFWSCFVLVLGGQCDDPQFLLVRHCLLLEKQWLNSDPKQSSVLAVGVGDPEGTDASPCKEGDHPQDKGRVTTTALSKENIRMCSKLCIILIIFFVMCCWTWKQSNSLTDWHFRLSNFLAISWNKLSFWQACATSSF